LYCSYHLVEAHCTVAVFLAASSDHHNFLSIASAIQGNSLTGVALALHKKFKNVFHLSKSSEDTSSHFNNLPHISHNLPAKYGTAYQGDIARFNAVAAFSLYFASSLVP
jgi:hypothetical protein